MASEFIECRFSPKWQYNINIFRLEYVYEKTDSSNLNIIDLMYNTNEFFC